jgi:hypothetical protein
MATLGYGYAPVNTGNRPGPPLALTAALLALDLALALALGLALSLAEAKAIALATRTVQATNSWPGFKAIPLERLLFQVRKQPFL